MPLQDPSSLVGINHLKICRQSYLIRDYPRLKYICSRTLLSLVGTRNLVTGLKHRQKPSNDMSS